MLIHTVRKEGSFPTQFYGLAFDGTCFYARYRGGVMSFGFGDTEDEAVLASCDLFNDGTGNGMMTWLQFFQIVAERRLFED